MTEAQAPRRPIRTYVRREGRITRAQRRALAELWPRYGVDVNAEPLDFGRLFGRRAPTALEIGFGNGEALVGLAEHNPGTNYLGIEVYRPGIGHLLLQLEARAVTNVRVIEGDARSVLPSAIPAGTLAAVYLLFPDPWPKRRHHKRRLVQPAFLELVCSRLEPSGCLYVATDVEAYALHVLSAVAEVPGLEVSGAAAAARDPRPGTRFERRGQRLGHRTWDLRFTRSP